MPACGALLNLAAGSDACTEAVFAADASLALVQVKLLWGIHLIIQTSITHIFVVLVGPRSPQVQPDFLPLGMRRSLILQYRESHSQEGNHCRGSHPSPRAGDKILQICKKIFFKSIFHY